MDIWQNGRQELFDELTKVCDRIGTNLAAELDSEANILISREKLGTLRQKAVRADELEDEVSSLTRRYHELDAKLIKAVPQEKIVEIERLREDNSRLREELETHKNASLRIEGLEKENKRLAAELNQALERAQDVQPTGHIGDNGPKTPALSGPPSSALRTDGDETPIAPTGNYESLVRKFNALHKKYTAGKPYKERLEKLLVGEKQKTMGYKKYTDHLERTIRKKDKKIEELRHLIPQARDVNDEPQTGVKVYEGRLPEPVANSEKECGAGGFERQTMTSSYNNRGLMTDDVFPVRHPFTHFEFGSIPSTPWSSLSEIGGIVSRLPSQRTNEGNTPTDLPKLLPGGHTEADERVAETEFEYLEPLPTSTTNEYNRHRSPEKAGTQEIKKELFPDAPPSPDAPIVIASKSVRKRKSHKDTVEPNAAPKVKIEEISSSPIGLSTIHRLDESLDLDDIGEKQMTPRKGRLYLQTALRTSSPLANVMRNESQCLDHSHRNDYQVSWQISQESQETPVPGVGIFSALQPRSPNTQILPKTSAAEREPKRRRIASDKAVSDLFEDGQVMPSIEKSSRKRNVPTPEQAQLLENLLEKASPTKHVLSPFRVTPIQPKPRRTGGGSPVSSRAYEVAQDDTPSANLSPPLSKRSRSKGYAEPIRPASRGSVPKSMDSSRASFKGSLKSSVEPNRPSSRGTFTDSAYESRPTSRDSLDLAVQASRSLQSSLRTPAQPRRPPSIPSTTDSVHLQRPSSKGTLGQFKLPKSAVKAASRARGQGIPIPRPQALRSLPLNELVLQDFKINPTYNGGYDYAFSAVVRNQEERRCLQGCTKPECCGRQFRVMAEATRDPTKPLSMSQEERDDKLLEDFLGDNSYKVRNMTKAERDETLMQALTRHMSNKYGNHRHAYERRQSPPGYWRSDFPDTQEEIQDRAKALQMEREQISRRYEEAMRKGGAYIFRDE